MINATTPPVDPSLLNLHKAETAPTANTTAGSNGPAIAETAHAARPAAASAETTGEGENDGERTARRQEAQSQADTRVEISMDEETGHRIFRRVVASSGYVLWQYPEEKLLERVREEKKVEGVLADKRV